MGPTPSDAHTIRRTRSAPASMPEPVTALIFDFDGCARELTEWRERFVALKGKGLQRSQRRFVTAFESNVRPLLKRPGKKLVMCGSYRQDRHNDAANREFVRRNPYFGECKPDDSEGLITLELPRLVERLRALVPGADIELYKLLLADGEGEAGEAWEDGSRRFRSNTKFSLALEAKSGLLAFQVERLQRRFGADTPLHIFFFDDKTKVLKELQQNGRPMLPPNVELTLVNLVCDGGDPWTLYDTTD